MSTPSNRIRPTASVFFAVVAGVALAGLLISTVLAETFNQEGQLPISSNQAPQDVDCGIFTTGYVWHFVTQGQTEFISISPTFSGTSVSSIWIPASRPKHAYVNTSGPGSLTAVTAVLDPSDGTFVLSHVCDPNPETPTPETETPTPETETPTPETETPTPETETPTPETETPTPETETPTPENTPTLEVFTPTNTPPTETPQGDISGVEFDVTPIVGDVGTGQGVPGLGSGPGVWLAVLSLVGLSAAFGLTSMKAQRRQE